MEHVKPQKEHLRTYDIIMQTWQARWNIWMSCNGHEFIGLSLQDRSELLIWALFELSWRLETILCDS